MQKSTRYSTVYLVSSKNDTGNSTSHSSWTWWVINTSSHSLKYARHSHIHKSWFHHVDSLMNMVSKQAFRREWTCYVLQLFCFHLEAYSACLESFTDSVYMCKWAMVARNLDINGWVKENMSQLDPEREASIYGYFPSVSGKLNPLFQTDVTGTHYKPAVNCFFFWSHGFILTLQVNLCFQYSINKKTSERYSVNSLTVFSFYALCWSFYTWSSISSLGSHI